MKKRVDNPDTFVENEGYHFEEEVEMIILAPRANISLKDGNLSLWTLGLATHYPRAVSIESESLPRWPPMFCQCLSHFSRSVLLLGGRSIVIVRWLLAQGERERERSKERRRKRKEEKEKESLWEKEIEGGQRERAGEREDDNELCPKKWQSEREGRFGWGRIRGRHTSLSLSSADWAMCPVT